MALNFPENPSNGQTHTENGITWVYDTTSTTWNLYFGAKEGKTSIATIKDQRSTNANSAIRNGGSAFAGANYRVFNTLNDPHNIGISLLGPPDVPGSDTSGYPTVIKVPAGTYRIKWSAPAYSVREHNTVLLYGTQQPDTESSQGGTVYEVQGSAEWTGQKSAANPSLNFTQSSSTGVLASVTFTETNYIRLKHWCREEELTYGLGNATWNQTTPADIFGDSVYAQIEIEDLATAVKDNATYVEGVSRVALLKDQKDYNIQGGTFTKDAWRDRDLTVEEDPNNFVDFYPTLNGQNTAGTNGNTPGYWSLPAGTYRIEWSAPGLNVNRHITKLVWSTTQSEISTAGLDGDITTAGDYTQGSSENTTGEGTGTIPAATRSFGSKVITTTQRTWFKILHWSNDTQDNTGFGQRVADSLGATNYSIYTEVRIEDLATAVKEPSTGITKVATVKDVKAHNVQGGDFLAATWNIRDLQTISDPQNIGVEVTGGNTVSVPAGTYSFKWRAPAYYLDRHTSRLAYSTSSTLASGVSYVIGNTGYSGDTGNAGDLNTSFGIASSLTFTQKTYIQVQHYSTTGNETVDSNGLGLMSGITGVDSVYTTLEIEDLATAIKEGTGGGGGGSGISLTDLSVIQNSASGGGQLSYNNSTGVFSYTPPVIGGGGGDTLPTRSQKSATAGTIASGASTDLDIAGHKAYHLLKIQVNYPAWVVIYTSDASRQADDSRAEGTDPLPGSGVIAEVSTTTANGATFIMSPGVFGWSDESTPSTTIRLKVKNKDSQARAINVELTVIQAEGPVV